jgi:hypothetical protein
VRAPALALALALICSACGHEHGPTRPPPVGIAPNDAALLEALDLRSLSAGQLHALDQELSRCLVRVGGAAGVPAGVRFRSCAFRQLAHNSISQRLNAVLALALTRRMHRGTCRANLFAFAGITQIVAAEAESMLRELNSQPVWSAHQRTRVRALRALARDTRVHLDPRAWRHDCALSHLGQLVE